MAERRSRWTSMRSIIGRPGIDDAERCSDRGMVRTRSEGGREGIGERIGRKKGDVVARWESDHCERQYTRWERDERGQLAKILSAQCHKRAMSISSILPPSIPIQRLRAAPSSVHQVSEHPSKTLQKGRMPSLAIDILPFLSAYQYIKRQLTPVCLESLNHYEEVWISASKDWREMLVFGVSVREREREKSRERGS